MKHENCLCRNCRDKAICSRDEMDIIFRVMDGENDVTLTDKNGIVLRVSDSYETHFGVTTDEVIGKSVFELEKEGVFRPSVTSSVLREKKKATILQKNKRGETVLTTGVPIFDADGEIEYVISFNSIDIADMTTLSEKYDKLNSIMEEYNAQLLRLKMQDAQKNTFITKSQSMSDINELITQIADIDSNVLITGETGVGKSMVAKIIHMVSSRAKGPFIEINCSAIPPALIESELFGYEKGAFTGANQNGKIGKIELADKGVLFLDEIGELSSELQVKLLQVIQEKTISRVGGLDKIEVDFRLVAATNKDLKKAVKAGEFREDLFYRLNVIDINIPPLRDRRDDIIPLIMDFLAQFNKRYKKKIDISPDALHLMEQYDWPGNIRQVENLVERLVVTAKKDIVSEDALPDEFRFGVKRPADFTGSSLSEIMESFEKDIFVQALKKYHTSVAVGKALGIGQTTAARKLRKYVPGYANKG